MPYIYLICAALLGLAYLLPYHTTPWPTMGSEVLTILAGSVLLFALYQNKVKIAKPQLLLLPVLLIPLIQYLCGQILYFSNALLSFCYIAFFWLMVVAGYNLSATPQKREKLFTGISIFFLIVGFLSSVIAIFQWLNLNGYFSYVMYPLKANRPYANMAQPNNLATLLTVSLLACVYFFEKRLIKKVYLIPISILLIFSIALTQSRTTWIVCIFIAVYWSIKQWRKPVRLSLPKLLLWSGLFVTCVALLPLFNQLFSAVTEHEVRSTASVVKRATSGFKRLDMWAQIGQAIQLKPWLGYGWNQTGMAQIAAFKLHPNIEWYKSAHNIIFDVIIWNGVIIGGLIVAYISTWLYWLNKGAKDIISVVATLMVCVILIHGFLEFPLHYAYFLLPAGFLLGMIQAQYPKLKAVNIRPIILIIIALISIVCSVIFARDYFLYKKQIPIVSQSSPITENQQRILDRKILLLTQFEERIWWVGLDPKTKMSPEQIQYIGRMVANLASKYDIYKYAQVLAFNGYKAEAEYQLWLAVKLHREKRTYDDLLK